MYVIDQYGVYSDKEGEDIAEDKIEKTDVNMEYDYIE